MTEHRSSRSRATTGGGDAQRPSISVSVVLGAAAVGILAGVGSGVFLRSLDGVGAVFYDRPWLVWGLPIMGLAMGGVFVLIGDRAGAGMVTVMRETTAPSARGVPWLLAPVVFLATLATHLVGGSAGREGTALQLSAGLSDPLARRAGFSDRDRRLLLMVAVSAGFGSVFGVPWAGAVFGIEVAPVEWRERVRSAMFCLIGSWTAHVVTLGVGATHAERTPIEAAGWTTAGWVGLGGVGFGLVAFVFVHATDAVRRMLGRAIPWLPIRLAVGGALVLGATLVLGSRDYNGLSLPLLDAALAGGTIAGAAFAWKAGFTAITIGSGFRGGEVTPLFVIGATLGASLAAWWGAPAGVLAAVGMVATFGAAANAPVASTVMGVELFGWHALPVMALGCAIARICSGPHHLYADGDAQDRQGRDRHEPEPGSVGGHR